MTWQPRQLSTCAKLLSGGTPRKSRAEYWDGDIPWVSSGEMVESFITDTSLRVTEEGAKNGTRRVPAGTVLVVVRGMSLAKEFRISMTMREMTFNQDLKALACAEDVHPKFLFYALKARKEAIRDAATDASHGTKKLDTDALVSVELPFPETMDEQARVAEVASAYDDLIENNRRRIALLEQAARLLYREWFVHFRFPGHETTKFVDGLPEEWSEELLSDLCTEGDGIQTGPFGSQLHQSDYTKTGVPVVMPKNIKFGKVDCDEIARIPESLADTLGRHRMQPGDTVFGRRGEIGRKAYIGERQAGFFCGTGCLRMRPIPEKIDPRYLFEALGSPATAGFIVNQAKGSTMPNLSAGALKNVPVLCPPKNFQAEYLRQSVPIFEQIEVLDGQNASLAEARDLLLPRLMDGRLPVPE